MDDYKNFIIASAIHVVLLVSVCLLLKEFAYYADWGDEAFSDALYYTIPNFLVIFTCYICWYFKVNKQLKRTNILTYSGKREIAKNYMKFYLGISFITTLVISILFVVLITVFKILFVDVDLSYSCITILTEFIIGNFWLLLSMIIFMPNKVY